MDPVILAAQIIEEDEEEFEQILLAIAEVAVLEIIAIEDGDGLGALGENWVSVNVDINEYHHMGDPCFGLHFRMSRIVFEALVQEVGNQLVRMGRLQRERTPLQDAILMVVWLLATPDTFRSVALRFGVRPSTLYYFYTYVTEALRELAPLYISWPERQERAHIKDVFQRATGFPGVVGCVDGTHVYITAPVQDAVHYRNRHHSYSINVQAVVDHKLLVRHLHVGEVGSMHDARVFRRSSLHRDFLRRPDQLVEVEEHLVGDGAYNLTDYMMIPFANNGHLTEMQRDFNRRLSQSRVRVENSFGRAKGKWRRLKFLHARNQQNVVDHVTASFVLHNFTILQGEPLFDEEELQRRINDNEVLGDEDFEDGGDEHDGLVDEDLLEAAKGRGIEKRTFIMEAILPDIPVPE